MDILLVLAKPLDGFKNICDSIAKVLEVINDPKAALMRISIQADKPKPVEGEDNTDGSAYHYKDKKYAHLLVLRRRNASRRRM